MLPVLTFVLVAALAAETQAQTAATTTAKPGGLRDISVSAAFGQATELERYPMGEMKWLGSVRFGLTPHLAIEAEIGRWAVLDYYDYVTDSPWNPGLIRDLEATRRISSWDQVQWQAGASLVARSTGSRLSFFGGGGLGVWFQDVSQSFEEQSLVDPTHHKRFADEWSKAAVGLQGLMGVDVALTRRLAVVGEGRMELVPSLDTCLFSAYAGVRVRF